MPIIRLNDVPEIAVTRPGTCALVMRKAIGSRTRDPAFAMTVQTPSLSITHIRIQGRLRQITCNESDRAMYVIEGDAVVRVGDEPPAWIRKGDFVLIPKGTPYEFKGNMVYLVINSPAYREGSDLRDDAYDGPALRQTAIR